jgi:hypothetical protein
MKRFLGMTDEELAENERLWKEENDENLTPPPGDASAEMRSAGISSADIGADLGGVEDTADTEATPVEGGETTGPETQTGAAPGQAAPTAQTV